MLTDISGYDRVTIGQLIKLLYEVLWLYRIPGLGICKRRMSSPLTNLTPPGLESDAIGFRLALGQQIEHLTQRRVGTLSGGEAQRVSLARTLVLEPNLVFLDEPFASLDAPTRFRLVGELADILTERRIAAFFVTHDLTEASALCQRCIVLDHRQVLQASHLDDVIHRPRSRRVAAITGMENMLEATVAGKYRDRLELDWDGQQVCVSAGCGHVGQVVTFTVRPQDVHMAPDRDGAGLGMNMFRGRVERIRPHGHTQIVSVRVGQTSVLQALVPVHRALMPGMEVIVTLPPQVVWIMTD